MKTGQMVQVIEYGGRKLVRRVISDRGRIVEVCNENEWKSALRDRREPKGIGFPRENVQEHVSDAQ
jgi:hypothetical protein